MSRFEHVAYKHHAPCRKASVHRIFDIEGEEAAISAAKRFKIKESSARTWLSGWKRGIGDCASARDFIAENAARKAAAKAKRDARKALKA